MQLQQQNRNQREAPQCRGKGDSGIGLDYSLKSNGVRPEPEHAGVPSVFLRTAQSGVHSGSQTAFASGYAIKKLHFKLYKPLRLLLVSKLKLNKIVM